MNIVFWMLVILAAVAAWFALSSQFWDIGETFFGLFQDAKDAINERENEEEKESE